VDNVRSVKEYEFDGRQVVRADLAQWRSIQENERHLFNSANRNPHWNLLDDARCHLADLTRHLPDRSPGLTEQDLDNRNVPSLKQTAVTGAAIMVVRSIGAAMSGIACGYSLESMSAVRRVVEATLNTEAIVDDDSGEYALNFLKGRSRGLSSLAKKFGTGQDVEFLSRFSHADVRGVASSALRVVSEGNRLNAATVSLQPSRNEEQVSRTLLMLAFEAVRTAQALSIVFAVAVEFPRSVTDGLRRSGYTVGNEAEGWAFGPRR